MLVNLSTTLLEFAVEKDVYLFILFMIRTLS